jgi:dipeptidyl aminopeptidase/acylaminoacyl peptidase
MASFQKLLAVLVCAAGMAGAERFVTGDVARVRSAGAVQFSPDGKRIAFTVENNDGPGRPYSQVWVMAAGGGEPVPLTKGQEPSSSPVWSPGGAHLAWTGKAGLIVSRPDGTEARVIAKLEGTNSPLPSTGSAIAWSPDGKQLAFVSSVPGPETEAATGDPVIITRYLYKPDYDEGLSHFNDNRRLHIFVADLASGSVRQLTKGNHYEHSIAWSPKGDEIAFVSNREPNEDQFFNYDLFTVKPAGGAIRRLTATESIEYRPHWSPDGRSLIYQGCKRGLTDLETTMEDTHVWAIGADGSNRRELVTVDNRQGDPGWSPDGRTVWFTVQERGSVHLYRQPFAGGKAERVVNLPGAVGGWSVAPDGPVAFTYTSPKAPAELYLLPAGGGAPTRLTHLNDGWMAKKDVTPVKSLTFVSNDNKWEVEAFLTHPLGLEEGAKHPLVVVIHGGPHAQQGPAFNLKNQIYASRGWATLLVNYRGSTGYGQAFADGVFGDQNGNEGQDVLYAVSAARRRNLWIDPERIAVEGVSYGGQLSAWLITQTRLFKSAIPTAAIVNLVSYNYTTYYNQYEQMTFGTFPHQGSLMDTLWERSALKHVGKVATPTLLVHGENDSDVPVSEAEQYFVALKDVGVETVFLRYPREGHGLREPKHVMDWIDRSMRWHDAHFVPLALQRR